MKINLKSKPKCVFTKDLDEAYNKGYFSGSISLDKLLEYLTTKFPELRVIESETHAGLFDAIFGKFVCGMPKFSRIPQFTISKYDKSLHPLLPIRDENGEIVSYQEMNFEKGERFVFCKGYNSIFQRLKGAGYEIDETEIIRYCT